MAKNSTLTTHPMRLICDAWLAKIDMAIRVREEKFGRYARETEKFYDGAHDFMWDQSYASGAGGFLDKDGGVLPTFRVTINEVFEAVALFVPTLYHKNPNIEVSPILPDEIPPEALGIDPNDPYGMQEYQMLAMEEDSHYKQKQACAAIKTKYLNWVQRETDKKTQTRRAITEAIVAGAGYMETSIYQPPASQIVMPRSTYVSWQDVVIDPDAAYWEDVQWIAIRRVRAVNLTERQFGVEEGELKGHLQSFDGQSTKRGKREAKNNIGGKSFDLIEYWEVYSKNGFGDRLADDGIIPKQHKFDYAELGDYCHLVVSRGIPFPLNCPSTVLAEGDIEEVKARVQWPIPFWNDQDGWPLSRLAFFEKSNETWPISLFKPAIGEMRFINWCMSFLADKVAASCHTYVGVLKSAGVQIQKQLSGSNTPFTIIEVAEALGIKSLSEVVSFLQAPNFPGDIWTMIDAVSQKIKAKTGVTELLQGMTSSSMRSAEEARVKNERVSVRPDDMAARTEDFLSEIAVREMQAARWFCGDKDVEPPLGRMGAMVWMNSVMSNDPDQVVRGFDYTIEAGSTRKPNKETKIAQLTEMGQYALPVLQKFAAEGQVDPYNAYMTEWCKANDLDPRPFLIQPPQANGPSPEEQQMQAEQEMQQQQMQADMNMKLQEFQLTIAEMQAKLGMEQQTQNQELSHAEDMHQLTMTQKREELALKKQESQARVQATKRKPAGTK